MIGDAGQHEARQAGNRAGRIRNFVLLVKWYRNTVRAQAARPFWHTAFKGQVYYRFADPDLPGPIPTVAGQDPGDCENGVRDQAALAGAAFITAPSMTTPCAT